MPVGARGSNPVVLTFFSLRWSSCWYEQAPVKRTDAGSIPAAAAVLYENVPLAEWQRSQSSKLDRRVQFPQGTLELNVAG